jgi:hypothetical protein
MTRLQRESSSSKTRSSTWEAPRALGILCVAPHLHRTHHPVILNPRHGVCREAVPSHSRLRGPRSRPAGAWLGRVLVLAVCGLSAACGDAKPDPWLEALKAEPLATTAPAGARLILDVENGEEKAFSKPIPARVLRAFAFSDRAARERGLATVIRTASASGWRVDSRPRYPSDPYFGAKRLAVGPATLTIGHFEKAGSYRLSVKIEEGACPRELCGT